MAPPNRAQLGFLPGLEHVLLTPLLWLERQKKKDVCFYSKQRQLFVPLTAPFREKVRAELLWQEQAAWTSLLLAAPRSALPPASRPLPAAPSPRPATSRPSLPARAVPAGRTLPEGREPPWPEASVAPGLTPAGRQPLTRCPFRGGTQGPSVHVRRLSRRVCPEYVSLKESNSPPLQGGSQNWELCQRRAWGGGLHSALRQH